MAKKLHIGISDIRKKLPKVAEPVADYGNLSDEELVIKLEKEMQAAAMNLEFERAAVLRDEIQRLKNKD